MITTFVLNLVKGSFYSLLMNGLTEKLMIKLFLNLAELFAKRTTNKIDDELVADIKARFK